MEIELDNVLSKLIQLHIDLRKLGKDRRLQNIGISKVEKAKSIYLSYLDHLESFKSTTSTSKKSEEFSEYIFDLCDKIDKVYKKILDYSVSTTTETRKQVKMAEKFDLKEAGILIPLYDGKDCTTERIIEGIEMMESMLKEQNNKKLLILFVLKTRFNKNARVKLNQEYSTIPELVSDIKKYLLPKKSANSLLIQLNNITQNNQSISEYGDKIETLFTNLTITQAGNNPTACEILRPINETMAIKKFADGLRNRRLGTIIAARNYKELKEAVQAAKDEDNSQPVPVVMSMRSNRRGVQHDRARRNYRGYNNQYYRGRGYGTNWVPNNFNRNTGNFQQNQYNRGRATRDYSARSRGARGARGYQQNVYTATTTEQAEENQVSQRHPNLSQFFRP